MAEQNPTEQTTMGEQPEIDPNQQITGEDAINLGSDAVEAYFENGEVDPGSLGQEENLVPTDETNLTDRNDKAAAQDDKKSEESEETEGTEDSTDDGLSIDGLAADLKEAAGVELRDVPVSIQNGEETQKVPLGEILDFAQNIPEVSRRYDHMQKEYAAQEGRHKEDLSQLATTYQELVNYVMKDFLPDLDKDPGWIQKRNGTVEEQNQYFRTREYHNKIRTDIQALSQRAQEVHEKQLEASVSRELEKLEQNNISREMLTKSVVPYLQSIGFSPEELPYVMDARIISALVTGMHQSHRVAELEKELAESKKKIPVKKLDNVRSLKGNKGSSRQKRLKRLGDLTHARLNRGESFSVDDAVALHDMG